MRFRIFFLAPLLLISACTPVVDPEEVELGVNLDGSVVLAGVPFELDIDVAFEDPEETVGYVLEIVSQSSESGEQVLASAELGGNHVGSVEVVVEQKGVSSVWSQLRNVDGDGVPLEGESVSRSDALEVFALDPSDADVGFENPPEIWLIDEPFTSAVDLSSELKSLPVEIVFEQRNSQVDEAFTTFFAVEEEIAPGSFEVEEFIEMRISVRSGPRVIAESNPHTFEVLSPQGMIQKFFYKEDQILDRRDPQEIFEWERDTSFPGFFTPTEEQIEQLLVEFEEGSNSPSGAIYFETIRDNTPNFDPSAAERFECYSVPEEWPPVPGKHFMFDYDRQYSLWIGDSKVGEGSDRGTRHLTFYDGKPYQWSYHC